jgi:hypothetical protein
MRQNMSQSRKRVTIVALAFLVLGLMVLAYEVHRRAILVTITNGSSGVISNIHVTYRGGELIFTKLESGENQSGYVHPNTETHLRLSFYVDDGSLREQDIESYMEPGYRGYVNIVVTDQKIITRYKVLPSFIPGNRGKRRTWGSSSNLLRRMCL